jgi:hypothetical protein
MGKRRMAGNRGPFIVATIDQHGKWFPACWIPIEKMQLLKTDKDSTIRLIQGGVPRILAPLSENGRP